MGTEFYVINPETGSEITIGKRSANLVFRLFTYASLGLMTLEDWTAYLSGKCITDEYGRDVSFDVMIQIITNSGGSRGIYLRDYNKNLMWMSKDKYATESDIASPLYIFTAIEGGVKVPKYLFRTNIKSKFTMTIAYGDGAYDYVQG